MQKSPIDEFLEKTKALSKEEAERLLSRARSKLMRRLQDKKLSPQEALAIQLEIEDEELNEWREKMKDLRTKLTFHE